MKKTLLYAAALLVAGFTSLQAQADEVVTVPDGLTPKDYTVIYDDGDQDGVKADVKVAFDGSDVYVYFPALTTDLAEGWVKGTLSGSQITFAIPQLIGKNKWDETCYFHACSGIMNIDELVFDYNEVDGSFQTEDAIYFAENEATVPFSAWYKMTAPQFKAAGGDEPDEDVLVVLPEGATPQDYTLTFFARAGKSKETEFAAKAAFVGDEVYISGFHWALPASWLKGTVSGSKISFKAGQFIGLAFGEDATYFQPFTRDEDARTNTPADELVFDYDAETGVFTADGYMSFSTKKGSIDVNDMLGYPTFKPNTGYEPVAPRIDYTPSFANRGGGTYTISLPAPDKDVNGQNLDMSALTYRIWYDVNRSEKLFVATASDYGFTDGDKNEFAYGYEYDNEPYPYIGVGMFTLIDTDDTNVGNWNRVGIQWILTYGGNRYESEIGWTKIKDYEPIIPATPTPTWVEGEGGTFLRLAIPTTDVNGNELDPSKISYKIYYDIKDAVNVYTAYADVYEGLSEDMSEFPFGFDDDWDIFGGMFYLYDNHDSKLKDWDRVGLQTIYTIDGERTESEIGWQKIEKGTGITGVESEELRVKNGQQPMYNLSGQRVNASARGIIIVGGKKVVR